MTLPFIALLQSTAYCKKSSVVAPDVKSWWKRFIRHIFYLFTLFPTFASGAPSVHCFTTNGIRICHNPKDISVFYNTPPSEVAYNIQTIHANGNYYTIYHSEPRGKLRPGDAIKAGIHHGTYDFHMPVHEFRIWGPQDDPQSLLDSDGVGGGGNPMTISGLPGDQYFYVFFLGVSDDARKRDHMAPDWRHYLLEARTKDFKSFDLKIAKGWAPFTNIVRPVSLKDTEGNVIRSNTARPINATQGLIGSISFVNGLYHYFYLDYAREGGGIYLYHRTTRNVSTGLWSPQKAILQVADFEMIRIAKARNFRRWVVMYGCHVHEIQDVCLQYTRTLDIFGDTGIAGLHLTSEYRLNLNQDGNLKSFSQPYWLTNRWGNLDIVGSDTGGEMYWTDMNPSNCSVDPHPYCPVAGGVVYRSGWGTKYVGYPLNMAH